MKKILMLSFILLIVQTNSFAAEEVSPICKGNFDGDYSMTKDVDCKGATVSSNIYYEGEFDGNGHSIKNLNIEAGDRDNGKRVGFFWVVGNDGYVHDVTFDNVTVDAGTNASNNTGIVSGGNDGKIENITIKNSYVGGISENMGGIVGMNTGGTVSGTVQDTKIKNNAPSNKEKSATGGAVGRSINQDHPGNVNVVIKNVEVSSNKTVGGGIGSIDEFSHATVQVNDSVVTSTVDMNASTENNLETALGRDIGGALGANNGGTISDTKVENTVVKGSKTVGGVIGWNGGIAENITSLNNTVTGNLSVGGAAGKLDDYANDEVGTKSKNITSNSKVKGNKYVGGVVGFQQNVQLEDATYNGESVVGDESVGGVVGRTKNAQYNNLVNNNNGAVEGKRFVGCLIGFDEKIQESVPKDGCGNNGGGTTTGSNGDGTTTGSNGDGTTDSTGDKATTGSNGDKTTTGSNGDVKRTSLVNTSTAGLALAIPLSLSYIFLKRNN